MLSDGTAALVDDEEVEALDIIRQAFIGRILSHGNAQTGAKICLIEILDHPAGLFELLADL